MTKIRRGFANATLCVVLYALSIVLLFIVIIVVITLKNVDRYDNVKNADNLTIVSGYWKVKNKRNSDNFDSWFKNTLKINQRYIFFTIEENFEYIRKFRNNYETQFVDKNLDDFYSKQLYESPPHVTHVPSKEVGYIWNEKIHLMKLAKDMDKQNNKVSEFYMWVDAGINIFRGNSPPTTRLNITHENFPKDKLIYSSVQEDYHEFSGGVLLMHNTFIDKFHDIYYEFLKNCKDTWKCGSDQYILTLIKQETPELFSPIEEKGYGKLLEKLFGL